MLPIGSGGIVHNLRRLDWQAPENQAAPWAEAFMNSVAGAIAQHDLDALCDPLSLPSGNDCLPTMEHYLPLLTVLGSCIDDERLAPIHREWAYGCLSLHSYAAGPGRPVSGSVAAD